MRVNRYTSSELFHLVGRSNPEDHESNYLTLLKVLDSRCISHPPHNRDCSAHRITFNWDESIFNEKLIVPEITCFCDIPYESLAIHVQKYGLFGLSFERELLIKYGARPVIYVPLQPSNPMVGWGTIFCETFLLDLEQIWRGVREQFPEVGTSNTSRSLGQKPDSQSGALDAMESSFTQHFLAFIKPFNSELSDHPDNYYMEREWRKFCNVRFQAQEVKRVVVAREYVERFMKERPEYSNRVLALPLD